MELMKRCSRCGQYKPTSEFNHHTDTPMTHRQPYCRRCQSEYAREHRKLGSVSVGKDYDVRKKAYDELYARYKSFRLSLDAYRGSFGDEPIERMSFEYELGL